MAFVFFDPNISLFPFYDLCVCVFFWFLCFFCFCLLEMANRRTRIPNRRHHTSTITGPTTNKTFSDRLPFYFHLFFFGFYLQNPASFSALGSWELTKENKMFRWCFCCFFGVQANLDLSLDPYYGQSAQQLLFGNCATVTNQKTTPQTPQTPSSIPDIVLQGGRSFFFFVIEPSTWNESSFHGTPIRRFLRLFFLLLVCLASDFSSTPEELARHGMAKDLNSAMGSSFDGVDFFPSDDALRGEGPRSKNPNPMNVAFVVVCCFHVR